MNKIQADALMTNEADMVSIIKAHGEFAHGGDILGISQEWIDNGFDADEVSEWLDAGCFDAGRAAELHNADITPEQVAADHKNGCSIGYGFANNDLSLGQVRELIEE